ncbi:MAG TPA: ABC transporter ATP-binding protein [Papillibacter sp.]|jgi:peptide/nickel transport system ATP-binding protein|nr:ABC transporter ATP-binding protein [Papillibacter sp.]
MENNNTVLLEVKDLKVEFHTDDVTVHAVNGVTLALKEGETLGLVGETGAGKTTIARTILGILPKPQGNVTQGEIFFEGADMLRLSEKEMKKIRGDKIAMIFQDPMTALNPIERVGDQIAEAIRLHNRISHAEAICRSMEMLEMVGIPRERYLEFPHQFSGGMKQRVVIAMALACNPKLLLADEPTTALDVTIQAQVLALMRDLTHRLGTSVLLITHDLGVVASTCQSVAVVYAGEIVEYGTVRHIFNNPLHPYTKGLFDSLPNLDESKKRLKPIKGMMPDPTNLPEGCTFCERCDYAMEICARKKPAEYEPEEGHTVRCFLADKEGI